MSSALPATDPARVDLPGAGTQVPTPQRLREALRAPETPLPFPASTAAAAQRMRDLIHAEQYGQARYILRTFQRRPATHSETLSLLRAAALLAMRTDDPQGAGEVFAAIVETLVLAGHPVQARAVAQVLGSRMDARSQARSSRATASAAPSSPHAGRRRGSDPQLSAALLAVVEAMEVPLDPHGDARADMVRARRALEALPEVRELLAEDVEPQLTMRLAWTCEAAGQLDEAMRRALDVLDLVSAREAEGTECLDTERAATSARALLARALRERAPLEAVEHALGALESLKEVEDPPLRVGLATDLLRALMAARLEDYASFTAGRLISLQRALRRDAHRIAPLLAVGAQRVAARRFDAAMPALTEAQRLAWEARDRSASLETARLLAQIHQENGDLAAALPQLRRVAADAGWIADDLLTSAAERTRRIRDELNANALVLRFALELEERRIADGAARAIIRRTRPGEMRIQLSPALLWDHEVDARVGRLLAAGIGLARHEEDVTLEDYDRCRREAQAAIDEVPDGHEARAQYWGAYLQDRHARMLAARGDEKRAVRAGRRARSAWEAIGLDEEAVQMDTDLERWASGA